MSCGRFLDAEDYRDHLPCGECDPLHAKALREAMRGKQETESKAEERAAIVAYIRELGGAEMLARDIERGEHLEVEK